MYPNAEEAYRTASRLYHEVLFQFPEAFALNQHWLERHPDDLSALSDFAEKHFTTGHFAECAQRIGTLVENPTVEASTKIALRAIEIANLLAMNNAALVPDKLQTLLDSLAAQPDDFKVTWAFNGTKHFIEQHAPLAPYRTWLEQLFTALEAEDRQTALTGLQAVRAGLQAVAKWSRENRDQSRFCPAIWTPTRTPRLVSTSQVCYGCPMLRVLHTFYGVEVLCMARHVDAQVTTVDYPDTDGLPMAESDFQRKPLTYAVEALDIYFQDRPDVYVSGNLFLYYRKETPRLWWRRMSLSCSGR